MSFVEHLQFCRGEQDITSDFHREDDATEVRVWDDTPAVVVSVERNDDGTWQYARGDYGPDPAWDTERRFASWREALDTFGYAAIH